MVEGLSRRVANIAEEAIERGVFPGCVVGVTDVKEVLWAGAFGRLTYARDAAPASLDTIFDVASLTKAIPTSSLALYFIGKGRVEAGTPLREIVPECRIDLRGTVTVYHLLSHTLDFGYRLSSLRDLAPEKILETIRTTPPVSEPGSVYCYTNTASVLLGIALERLGGAGPADLAREIFFEPLGMGDTGFGVDRSKLSRVAPSEIDERDGSVVRGVVHDESARSLLPLKDVGSAGVFSTAGDILKFLRMLLAGGFAGGRRFLEEETVELISRDCIPHLPECTGLGWELAQRRFMGGRCSDRTFGKTGFTGSMCAVDVRRGRGLVMLANHTFPRRRSNRETINAVRRAVADAVWEEE